MKKRVMSLLAVFMVCFCCGVLVQGNRAKAAMTDEAEVYELGEQYNGSLNVDERYYQFEITEKSHISLNISRESNNTFEADIYDAEGKVVLSRQDLVYETNALTGWKSASQSRNLPAGVYYLRLYGNYQFNFNIQAEKQIKLPKGKVSSLKSSKAGQMTVRCTTADDALGYRIQYSTDYKFKKGVKTIKTAESAVSIKGLKKGARYYVKVCPYNVYDDGVTVYGQNSLVKSVKIKK